MIYLYPVDSAIGFPTTYPPGPVVQKFNNAINWINIFAVDNAIDFPKINQLDSV